jgi:hypothetical protein
MEKFDVYLYVVPRVTPDGKSVVPTPDAKTQSFDAVDAAKKFAAQQKAEWERVVLIKSDDQGQHLVERYVDGKRETPEQIVRR